MHHRKKRSQASRGKMRHLQKPHNPPRRFKRIRRVSKSQEKKFQSKTTVRRKFLRRFNPKRNHRLHERPGKTNERNGRPLHGRFREAVAKFLTWQKKKQTQ